MAITIVPASEAGWEDLQAVFGTRGAAFSCQCQRYKLRPREAFRKFPVQERAERLLRQTGCGHPEADATSGLVAYLDGQPAGWCAVEPRTAYEALVRNARVPWEGRDEDRTDDSIVGTDAVFAQAGLSEVSRPTPRRIVMRIDF